MVMQMLSFTNTIYKSYRYTKPLGSLYHHTLLNIKAWSRNCTHSFTWGVITLHWLQQRLTELLLKMCHGSIASLLVNLPATPLLIQPFVEAYAKESIKAPRYRPLERENHRWPVLITLEKYQREKTCTCCSGYIAGNGGEPQPAVWKLYDMLIQGGDLTSSAKLNRFLF